MTILEKPDLTVSNAPTAHAAHRSAVQGAQLSFRARLTGMFLAFGLVMNSFVIGVILLNARAAVQEEVSSSFGMASRYLQSRKIEIQQATFPDSYLANLGLEQGAARHVRAIAIDSAGRVVPPRFVPDADDDAVAPPEWFTDLLAIDPLREEILLVFKSGQTATIVLESEPYDEIAEVWQDFRFVVPVTIGFTALLMAASLVMLSIVFRRIRAVSEGLGHLHGGRLDARLQDLGIPELAAIVGRFNELAERLSDREVENRELNRRLLSLQDDERRQIAQELHDELGPYLFALRTATARRQPSAEDHEQAVTDLDPAEIAQAIQSRTRSIITALRPMSLGEVPLGDLIEDLAEALGRLANDGRIHFESATGPHSFGEALDLTVYRFVQESVLNAMRHGRARSILVHVEDRGDDLFASVSDDGLGPEKTGPNRKGYGFSGISERVRALGGTWERPHQRDGRTITSLRVPVEQRHRLQTQDI